MITEGLQYALTGQWWIGVFPGVGLLIAISATADPPTGSATCSTRAGRG